MCCATPTGRWPLPDRYRARRGPGAADRRFAGRGAQEHVRRAAGAGSGGGAGTGGADRGGHRRRGRRDAAPGTRGDALRRICCTAASPITPAPRPPRAGRHPAQLLARGQLAQHPRRGGQLRREAGGGTGPWLRGIRRHYGFGEVARDYGIEDFARALRRALARAAADPQARHAAALRIRADHAPARVAAGFAALYDVVHAGACERAPA
jgi:hypothetical protein